jgi:hypothetical protein
MRQIKESGRVSENEETILDKPFRLTKHSSRRARVSLNNFRTQLASQVSRIPRENEDFVHQFLKLTHDIISIHQGTLDPITVVSVASSREWITATLRAARSVDDLIVMLQAARLTLVSPDVTPIADFAELSEYIRTLYSIITNKIRHFEQGETSK